MRFRHGLMAALFAAGVLALGGPARTQDPQDPIEPKAKQKAKADDKDAADKPDADKDAIKAQAKDLADAKKTIAAQAADLAALKKSVEAVTQSVTASAGDFTAMKTGAAASQAKLDASAKSIETIQKAVADAKSEFDAAKKGVDESLKGVSDIKTTADAAKDKAMAGDLSRGDTAWMLVASAFVMLMVPGLALFYGGMVRRKNILATMMQSMACLSIVGLFWVAFGYGLAFGPSVLQPFGADAGGVIGWNWDLFFLQGVAHSDALPGYKIPVYVHVMFQGMFAIITPALISGAVAERIRFWPFCIFTILWISFVYCPLAHMVWAFDWFDMTDPGRQARGVGHRLPRQDGRARLRRRHGRPHRRGVRRPGRVPRAAPPRRLPQDGDSPQQHGHHAARGGPALVRLVRLQRRQRAGQRRPGRQCVCGHAGRRRHGGPGLDSGRVVLKGKPTALGLASGIVAGLVAVTPASGYVYVWGGVAIGAVAAVGCYLAVMVKNLLGYDDSLDAFGVHGVGGFIGAVLTGIFCYSAIYPAGGDGFFAMKGQDARVALLEKSGIADAKKEAAAKQADFDKVKANYDALTAKGKDKLTDDEKKAFDAGEVAELFAKESAAAVGTAEAELKTLKETVAKRTEDKENTKGPLTQLFIQLKAAGISAVYALVASAVLVLLTQLLTLGHFSTSKKDETTGLDQTEHGETGFDFGLATETSALRSATEPKAATTPKAKSSRFELAVEGATKEDIVKLWTGLCQPGDKPAPPDFLAVYPNVTTFSGNRFQCRGADAPAVAARLESLFKKLLPGKAVKVVRL